MRNLFWFSHTFNLWLKFFQRPWKIRLKSRMIIFCSFDDMTVRSSKASQISNRMLSYSSTIYA